MNNAPSLAFVIVNFLVLNLMLMNLLIAMMASTYEKVTQKANTQLLLYKYSLLEEHSRRAIAAPVPFNVILLIIEVILYCWENQRVKDRYPDCTWGQRIDVFLSRNWHCTSAKDQKKKPPKQWIKGAGTYVSFHGASTQYGG